MECLLESPSSTCVWLIVIYRPLPSKKNKLTHSIFLHEFAEFIEVQTISTGRLLIIGDFNIHLGVPDDTTATAFNTMLESANLVQHIHSPIHQKGNTLDLVITRATENTIQDLITENVLLSDPFLHLLESYFHQEALRQERHTLS